MKKLAIGLSLGLMLFGCSSSDGDGGGGTGGPAGAGGSGGGDGVGPVAPLAIECGLLGNDATFPFEFDVALEGEPTIGQPVDATVTVSLVFSADLACGILAAGFTSVGIESGSDTVTITGVSEPDPAEVTVTLAGTPITGLQFSDGCGCADPGQGELVPPCGTGPGLEFNFDPETVSVTPDGAATMDFLLTLDGVNLNLANLAGDVTIPSLNIPEACSYGFIGADLDGDEEYSSLATPPLQIQIPVLCDGVDCNDDNDCTADACVEGACSSTNVADDTPCNAGAGLCQAGACVDRCDGVTCEDDGNECTDDVCNPVAWLRQGTSAPDLCENPPVEDGTSCDSGDGMCVFGVCRNACSGVDCDDGNECTEDLCNPADGVCSNPNLADNTPCMGDEGICQMGTCLLLCADANTRCDDGNDCTTNDCNPADGNCINDPLTGTTCMVDSSTGTCNAGVCEVGGLCDDAATRCDDGNECTEDLCNPEDGVCSNPELDDWTSCGGDKGFCQSGQCVNQAIELLAIDCELLGNSAALPISSTAIPDDVALAGQPVDIVLEHAIILPADLVCGFIGAGFQEATVANSQTEATYTNADLTDTGLTSFLDDGSASPTLVSPHMDTVFQFGEACGDNCTDKGSGSLTCSDGTTPCALSTFEDDCPDVGTGPGIVAPFLANGPGSIPPGTDPVTLTPTSPGTVDIDLPYSGIALNLPDVGGLASGCIGGACTSSTLCAGILRGAVLSPRVMYDANCNKAEFAAETCSPFEDFRLLGDVCKGAGIEVNDFITGNIPACCDNTTDLFCTTQSNIDACCAQLDLDFPTATAMQQPQLNVAPAP